MNSASEDGGELFARSRGDHRALAIASIGEIKLHEPSNPAASVHATFKLLQKSLTAISSASKGCCG